VDSATYYSERFQLVCADSQWRQQMAGAFAAGAAAAGQSMQQSYQNQQWLNAYNQRTVMMAYPQTINMNVEHSGTIYVRDW
jgi:hypothetical protein